MGDRNGNLGGDTLRSVALHAGVAVGVLALGTGLFFSQNRTPATWATVEKSDAATVEPVVLEVGSSSSAVPDGTAEDTDRSSAWSEAAPPPMPEQALAGGAIETQLEQALGEDMLSEDEAALLAAAQEFLRRPAGSLDAAALSGSEPKEMVDALKQHALEGVRERVQEMARDAVVAEVASQLDGQLYDQVKARLDSELQGRMADELRRRLMEAMREEHRDRVAAAQGAVREARKQMEAGARQLEGAREASKGKRVAEAQRKGDAAEEALGEAEKHVEALRAAAERVPQVDEPVAKLVEVMKGAPVEAIAQAEAALEQQNGDAAAQSYEAARAELQARIEALRSVEQALGQVRDKVNEDAVSRQALDELLPELRERLAGEVLNQPLDPATQAIVDKLMAALAEQIQRFELDAADLRKLIEAQVRQRLATNLREKPPEAGAAFTRVRQEMRLRAPEELAAAQRAAEDAAAAVEQARDAQRAVNLDDASQSKESLAAQQAAVAEAYKRVEPAIEGASDAARNASADARGKVDALNRAVTNTDAAGRLEQLPAMIDAEDRGGARPVRDALVRGWDEQARTLRELAGDLGREREQAAAGPGSSPRSEPGSREVDTRAVEAVKEEAQTAVSEVAAARLPEAVRGLGGIEVKGLQGLDARLAGLEGVYGRLGQLAANAADGRPVTGLDAMSLGLGGLLGGNGWGENIGAGMYRSHSALLNAEAIDRFGKELRERNTPEAYYADAGDTTGVASVAAPVADGDLPAVVFMPVSRTATVKRGTPEEAQANQRQVPAPAFKHVAFGAAAMMDRPITIDGDLSDWGELRHPIPTRFEDNGQPAREPVDVYFRWSPEGIFVAYTVKKAGAFQPNSQTGWEGDCIEVWLETTNSRVRFMKDSVSAHQFFLMPFGYRGDAGKTLAEYSRGTRGMKSGETYVHPVEFGRAAAKGQPGVGYTVEGFIGRRAMAKPNLYPGAYLAMNYSLNRGPRSVDWQQWSAPKTVATWDKPDTWGDLLLLGSDGAARFVGFEDTEAPAEPLVPGRPVAFEVRDKDMDLNPRQKDLLPAMLRAGGAELVVILEETAPDSGVFRGSANTQPAAAPPKPNTLGVRGGDALSAVELVYTDARAEYGEANRTVTATLPIGAPVMTLMGRKAGR